MKGEKLAIDGGYPVRSTFLPFGTPCLGQEEIDEVLDTLRSGWIGTGPKVLRFEAAFAGYIGVPHALAVSSCTAGLFLSLLALGIGPGDEVITTPLTFAATVNVIEHVGARPILADIDPTSLNIDPVRVEQAITPRTRAIICVHFGGLPCDMAALQAISQQYHLALIEDASHAVGSRYRGQMVGTLGTVAAFSFYANKNLTTAEGGMVTTDDRTLADAVRLLRLHGLGLDAWQRFNRRDLRKTEILTLGYKCNLSDLAASLGIHQLSKQERFLEIREQYASIYDQAFADLPVRRQLRPLDREENRHGLHLYVLVLDDHGWSVPRDRVVAALLQENVGAVVHYPAIHTQPYYFKKYHYSPWDFPYAYRAGEHLLSLPLTPGMSASDVVDVVTAFQRIARAYAA